MSWCFNIQSCYLARMWSSTCNRGTQNIEIDRITFDYTSTNCMTLVHKNRLGSLFHIETCPRWVHVYLRTESCQSNVCIWFFLPFLIGGMLHRLHIICMFQTVMCSQTCVRCESKLSWQGFTRRWNNAARIEFQLRSFYTLLIAYALWSQSIPFNEAVFSRALLNWRLATRHALFISRHPTNKTSFTDNV